MASPDAHPGNSVPGGDPDVTAAYWAFSANPDGSITWMWNCDACPGIGTAGSEAAAIRGMNSHVAEAHPGATYVPTPEPA